MNGIGRVETSRGISWRIRYRVPLAPGSTATKQVTETLRHCASRTQAQGVLARRHTEIFENTYRPRNAQKPVTVSQAIETFLDKRKSELRDHAGYARTLRNHVGRLLGKVFMFEVTTGKCEDYRRARFAEGAAKATVRKELRYLQSVFVQARKDGVVTHDPVSDVSFKGINNARERFPSPDELARLVDAALESEGPLRPVFFVLMCTGLRVGSALALRWENVHPTHVEVEQKGGTLVRPPMSSLLRAELDAWRPMSESLGKGSGWVFPSLRGGSGHLSKTAVVLWWPDLLARARVEGITRHDMRRWMVTALRGLGADDKAIKSVSGQATVAMIDRYDQGAHGRASVIVERITDLKAISAGVTHADPGAPSEDKNATDTN